MDEKKMSLGFFLRRLLRGDGGGEGKDKGGVYSNGFRCVFPVTVLAAAIAAVACRKEEEEIDSDCRAAFPLREPVRSVLEFPICQ
jgi:hypothetical protein